MFHEFDGTVSFPLSSIPRSREMRRVINMCDVRERGGHASSSTFPHIDVSCITHLSRDVYFPFFSLHFARNISLCMIVVTTRIISSNPSDDCVKFKTRA